MNQTELMERVDKIIEVGKKDCEAGHGMEDDLYFNLLMDYLPEDLREEVIRLSEADFNRWCA
jgi:hypothetical protein